MELRGKFATIPRRGRKGFVYPVATYGTDGALWLDDACPAQYGQAGVQVCVRASND